MANNSSLKEVICENLTRILSVDKQIRENAEQQLNMLETNEDYGLHLMEISLSDNLDFSIRHLSSVLLDRYITKHWNEHSPNFQPPEINSTVKQLIRDYLLKSLSISISEENFQLGIKKLLNSFSHSLSKIAQIDWPHKWPQLFPVLIGYLGSGSQSAIYSSLKVFEELSHEITDTQIPNVAPILLPQMLNIFVCNSFSIRTRSNAIKIFATISETIMLMDELQKDSIKQYLSQHIPQFAESVINIMMMPEGSPDVDIGLKKEIISALTRFLRYCRKYMKVYLPKILELIWHNLTTSANIYVQRKVNSFSSDDSLNEICNESVDSDGETIGFESFVYSIIDFVNSTFEFSKYRVLIKPVLSDLLYYVLFFVQITDEQAEIWQSNLDQLIDEDDMETHAYSVRIAAQDLIMNLARDMTTVNENFPKKDDQLFKMAFLQAIKRHFSEASELEKSQKESGVQPQTWWKSVESCLYTMGVLAPTIIYTINSGQPLANDYKVILDNVLSNLNTSEPFLAGRSLWTASRFSTMMNDQSLDNFLKLTSSLLGTVEAPTLRVYALRATYYFCENVHVNHKVSVITPYLNQFLQGLVSIGMQSNTDTLFLVLQTIDLLLNLDKDFTASVSSSICSLATSAFLQYPDDLSLFSVLLDLFDRLFQLDQCRLEIQNQLLPMIVSILNAPPNGTAPNTICFGNKPVQHDILTLQPQVLDILSKLVQNSKPPLSDVLVQKVYPALINCLQNSPKEDSAILQNGSECIRFFLANFSDQLISYVDPSSNQNGIQLALNVCNNLLNPQVSDSASAYIGRLVITLILKANQLIGHENIQHLLRSTLVRLNTSKELPLTQSLILVFAHLLYSDLPTIVMFLSSLPAPDGTKSALEFVLDKWLGIQRYFHGYENKASTIALCRLFQHSLQHQADIGSSGHSNGSGTADLGSINLHHIEVTCDDEFDNFSSSCIRTRSKSAQTNNQTKRKVPCTVKMLKLLINELSHLKELKSDHNFGEDDEDYDDDEDEDDDDDEGDLVNFIKDNSQPLGGESSKVEMIDLNKLLEEEGEDLNSVPDDEILSEEINNIDLENVLRTILLEFRRLPIVAQFVSHMTNSESLLLNEL